MSYKVCPSCGKINSEQEIVCVDCMTDLTDAEVVAGDQEIDGSKKTGNERTSVISESLTLSGNGFSITVKSGDIVGRQGVGSEHLKYFKTVSRKHAKFYKDGGRWFVEDLGSTNGTFLNDRPIPPNQKHEIKDGYIIKLSTQVSLRVKL